MVKTLFFYFCAVFLFLFFFISVFFSVFLFLFFLFLFFLFLFFYCCFFFIFFISRVIDKQRCLALCINDSSCFAAAAKQLESLMHRARQRCFELLALISSPQHIETKGIPQLDQPLGQTGQRFVQLVEYLWLDMLRAADES